MALIPRLVSFAAAAFGLASRDEEPMLGADEHLAATALLVHVARVDGVLDTTESERLARIVQSRYASSAAEARNLIARAAAFDAQNRDLADLVELIGSEAPLEDRSRLLSLVWSIASADGEIHEFEEALVWRLGKLLGLNEATITAARTAVPDGLDA